MAASQDGVLDSRGAIGVLAAGRGNPWVNLTDGYDLGAAPAGSGRNIQEPANHEMRPLSLTSGDVDGDGVPDLLSGYGTSGGGVVWLHRGNVDAIYPDTPEARKRREKGAFTGQPFYPPETLFNLPAAPDFLEAGDFDADGHLNILGATRGSSEIHWLRGDGAGGFSLADPVSLPGKITVLKAGEFNRRDTLTDVVVGITGTEGSSILIFQSRMGALIREPARLALTAPAVALDLGRLDDHYPRDLLVAAGEEILMVMGRDGPRGDRVSADRVLISRLPFPVQSVVSGDFIWDPLHRVDLAILSPEGTVYIMKNRPDGNPAGLISLKETDDAAAWDLHRSMVLPTAGVSLGGHARPALLRARISSIPADDLLVLDSCGNRLHILMGSAAGWKAQEVSAQTPDAAMSGVPVSLDLTGEPLAVIPMRLNVDALDDLVILKDGAGPIAVVMTASGWTFTVNQSGDESDEDTEDGYCDSDSNAPGFQCTLRAALEQADALPGADTIEFQVGYVNLGQGLPFVKDPVTINGNSVPTGNRVELDGSEEGEGLSIDAGSSVVRGLVINGGLREGLGLHGVHALYLDENGGNIIEGNYLGTDISGQLARPSFGGLGIEDSSNNTIGGTVAAARNLISGNAAQGFSVVGNANNNHIIGNFIGTNVDGSTLVPNYGFGLSMGTKSEGVRPQDNIIEENVISGTWPLDPVYDPSGISGVGVSIQADGTLLKNNFIGTGAGGSGVLGNYRSGIWVTEGYGNCIEKNTIAHNGGDGVILWEYHDDETTHVGYADITQNAIFSNAGLGINLTAVWPPDAVTPNDPAPDADTGPNGLQNFPEIVLNEGRDEIALTLTSTPNTEFVIEFFASPGCDPSGYGEGQIFLDQTSWFGFPYPVKGTTGADGVLNMTISLSQTVPEGQVVTATATNPEGHTSEFSKCAGQAGEGIALSPRLILGLGLCGNASRSIEVRDLSTDDIITASDDVTYEWIELNGLSEELATHILDELKKLAPGMNIPDDPIATISVEKLGNHQDPSGVVKFLTSGVNVLRAKRTLPGGKVYESNAAFLIGGKISLAGVDSLDVEPLAATSPLSDAATYLTSRFLGFLEGGAAPSLNAPMILFPPSAEGCNSSVGSLGHYGFVTVKSVKFNFFDGLIKDVDLMEGLRTLIGLAPTPSPITWIAKAIAVGTAPVTVAQLLDYQSSYEMANPGQQDPFMDVSNEFGSLLSPDFKGKVTALGSGISGVQATFDMADYCIEGKAIDLMMVLILPDLEKVDIRNEQGVVEGPIDVGVKQTRQPHAVGMFNAFSQSSEPFSIPFDPLGHTGEELKKLAEKIIPGGREVFEDVGVPIHFTLPLGASLGTRGLYEGGDAYLGLEFTWLPLGPAVQINALRIQTRLPDVVTTWSLDPTPNDLATVDSDTGLLTGVKPGLTELDLDVCLKFTSISHRTDTNGIRVLAGHGILVQKYEDKRATSSKEGEDTGLNGWTITLQRVDNEQTTSGVTQDWDINEDGVIDERSERGWAIFEDLEATSYRVLEKERDGWTRTTPDPGVITLEADQMVTVRFGNYKHITIQGKKFDDKDGDGFLDPGEPGLAGWRIEVDLNSDGSVEHAGVTDAGGNYLFEDIGLGDLAGARHFTVREVPQPGYVQTFPLDNGPIPFFSDLEATVNFGNFMVMEVRGRKFDDRDGDGVQGVGEPGLAGWRIELDLHDDGIVDDFRITDGSGDYVFDSVGPGDPDRARTLKIREVPQPGWVQTFPENDTSYPIQGGRQVIADFGNFEMMKVRGKKFDDRDGDGVQGVGEPGLPGWRIELDLHGDGIVDDFRITDRSGDYAFDRVDPGDPDKARVFRVREVLQPDWIRTFPENDTAYPLQSGLEVIADFGNFKRPKVCGRTFDDLNGNGVKDGDDTGLSGWTVELVEPDGNVRRAVTQARGGYCFEDLDPGLYLLRETLLWGWTRTFPPEDGMHRVTAKSGEDILNLDFGNYSPPGDVVLCGLMFHDLNQDGTRDSGEPVLENWTVELISGIHTVQTTHTRADGVYCFANVREGAYHIREVPRRGWVQTFPGGSGVHEVAAVSGQDRDDLHFGNFHPTLYVEPGGLCGGNATCFQSIQGAVDGAPGVANLRIAEGDYGEDVEVNHPKELVLQGGYDSSFASSSGTSAVRSITIRNGTLIPSNLILGPVTAANCVPALVSPAEGAVMDNGCCVFGYCTDDWIWDFVWLSCPGATEYHLYVYNLPGGRVQVDESGLTDTTFRVPSDRYNVSARSGWHWRIRAKAGGVWGDWSPERTFDVEPTCLDD